MDYVAGPSLAQVVREGGAQPPQRVRTWLRQATEALAYAHGEGVLHRDVKSANLLLETARDRLFVSDFGLARAAEASGGSSAQSDAHLLTGTAAYRAPEVHRTGHSVASDLYSLGVVGYELLAGRRPFENDDPLSLLLLHATEPVPPLPAATPAPLARLVMALLAKDPAQRPASAAAVVEALTSSVTVADPPPQEATPPPADLPPVKPPPPAVSSTGQPPARPPRRWLGWLAGGVAVVAVLLLAVWALNRPPGATQPLPTDTPAPPTATAQPPMATSVPPTATPNPPTDTPIPPTATPEPPTPTPTLGVGSTMISEIDGMEYVYVPAGEFLMGSTDDDELAKSDEKPQHTVYLDGYWIARTEVTNAMFARFVAETGYRTEAEKADSGRVFKFVTAEFEETPGANWRHPRGPLSNLVGLNYHPVVQVSWNDAVAYCQWAGCRLPTEAEWEKAARGVDGRLYPWGNGTVRAKLNFADVNLEVPWADKNVNDGYTFTAPVGSYPAGASPFGALDMAGNVWEWVADWYEIDTYTQSLRENPQGPDNGSMRILRGGAWSYTAQAARTSDRSSMHPPDFRSGPIGFRPARSP
jgi:formylglycine-generating enzyme required for sulfatase activity